MPALLLDIGNSFVETAIWTPETVSLLDRFPTSQLNTKLPTLLRSDIQHVVISSVVPRADTEIRNYFDDTIQIDFVTWENMPILKLALSEPSQIGADRLVNAMAAYHRTQGSVMVVDCGTATTCCYVDATGIYQGGAIFPGLRLSSQALHDHTAKIPLIFITPRVGLFGKNTEEAVQSGIFHSHIFALNGFIAKCREQDPRVTVIGTGNGLESLKNQLHLDQFDAQLIFHGLGLCAQAFSRPESKGGRASCCVTPPKFSL
jgi:type III pantothenate kinase